MKRLRPLRKASSLKSTTPPKTSTPTVGGPPSALQLISELLIVFGIIVFGVAIFLWWHYVESNPKRVFEGTLSNALQVQAATVDVSQSADGQSLKQTIDFATTTQQVAHGETALSQAGSTVTTETIGTPTGDYVRYKDIQTSQLGPSGKPLNFNKILGIWGRTNSDVTQTNGQLYNQMVLGVIPFGSLSYSQRQTILKLMQPTYLIDYNSTEHTINNNRPTYIYHAQIMPIPYVKMLKQYAQFAGLTQLQNLDPANYSSATALHFNVTVDVWSRQIRSITYDNSNRVEQYSQLGKVMPPINIPTNAIPISELQSKLQTAQ